MKLEKIVGITGQPGLFRVVSSRTNGVVVTDLNGSNTRFMPAKGHQMLLLDVVAIYTDTDTLPLKDILRRMLEQIETTPPPPIKSADAVLRAYMTAIMPEHDRDRVHISDIKKLIKWFGILNQNDIITLTDPEPEVAEEVTATEEAPAAEEAPAPKAAKKKKGA